MPLEHVQLSTACWFLHRIPEQACFYRWAISWHWISLPRNTRICPLLWQVKRKRDDLLIITFAHLNIRRPIWVSSCRVSSGDKFSETNETKVPVEIFWNHDITRHAMILQGHRLKFNANWATWHRAESKVAERITVHEKNDNAWTNSSQLWQFLSKVVASLLSHVSCSSGFDLWSQYFPHIDTVVAFQGTIWVCPKLQEVEKKLYEIVEMVLSSFLGIIQHYSTSFNIIRNEVPEVPSQNIVNWLSSMAIGCWLSWL